MIDVEVATIQGAAHGLTSYVYFESTCTCVQRRYMRALLQGDPSSACSDHSSVLVANDFLLHEPSITAAAVCTSQVVRDYHLKGSPLHTI